MTTTESLDEVTPAPSSQVLTDANEQHKVDLLEQFYLTLQVTYMASPLPPSKSVIHERIERLFKAVHSWPNAYEIEQLLCFVISEQQLETELNRRLAEAQTLQLEHVAIIDNDIPEIDADTKFDPFLSRDSGVPLDHPTLDIDRTFDCVHDTSELY